MNRFAQTRLLAFWIALACALFTGTGKVEAQASVGLSPAMVVKDFTPGKPFEFEVMLNNSLSTPVVMHTQIRDWWYDSKNQKLFGEPGSHANSASNWMQAVPEQVTVPAQSNAKIKVVVTPPAKTEGGYYSVLFVESRPEATQDKTAEGKPIFANFRLGTLVMLTAAGTAHYKIDVSDKKFTPPGANQNLKLEFQLQNLGNSHIYPQIELSLLNDKKELVAKADAGSKRFLPEQKDSVVVDWGGTLAPGKYSAILSIVYGKNQIYTDEFSFETAKHP
ncbi:MAG: hypothetical protein JWO20_716 [Candidatus Angelobacter sp.]|nr:hypothetical protein [Candidatus Angelobacter sp.]